MSSPPAPPVWAVVVPVKRLSVAKTRLAAVGPADRERLALAFAEDVVRAALACPLVARVLVVTDDGPATEVLVALGADVAPDLPGGGLNEALRHGADLVRARDPLLGVCALSGDLPAVRPGDLSAALGATIGRGYVADADGVGTTLLAAAAGTALDPRFGPGSAARHHACGARPLPAAPGLRRDVDTPADLSHARLLGVGPSTAAVLTQLDAASVDCRPPGQGTMSR